MPGKKIPIESEIIFYSTPEGDIKVEVFFQDETVWLTQKKMAELFSVGRSVVTKHLRNIFKERELQNLLKKVSNAINIILRPIEMIDQFKCRMNLIEEGKINSEDIAKLTSLKDNSHYDVLRERFFFQTQIGWFFELYSEEILKFQK